MLTYPNILSLMRGPLALFFLQEDPFWRTLAILLAMATDFLDGYISRYYRQTSWLGTLLDPIMDKFFVLFVMLVLLSEQRLSEIEAAAMFCRDMSVFLFGFYLFFKSSLLSYKYRAIWCGKITTSLQFLVLLGLTNHMNFPPQVYGLFIILGLLALVELYFFESRHEAEY